jgi:hypothetical protein
MEKSSVGPLVAVIFNTRFPLAKFLVVVGVADTTRRRLVSDLLRKKNENIIFILKQ